MGRTSDARDRLVTTTIELMQARGYAALGVADICAAADVRKGSFYHFFASKQALTLEVLDVYWAGQRENWLAVLKEDGSALDRLQSLLTAQSDAQCEAKATTGAVTGCLIGNLALELSAQDHVVQTKLDDIFNEQISLVESLLDEAAASGEIAASGRDLARSVIAHLEGMVLFAKVTNDPGILHPLFSQVKLLLGAA